MTHDLRALARQLMWSSATIDQLGDADENQLAFLTAAMTAELANRDAARKARYRRQAGFPFVKGFTDYDWSHVDLPPALDVDDIKTCGFITRRENLVLLGPVGNVK